MLEFAREQWLWLFLLVAVFYVAWWFARRYRKQRVTYGRIWERVAKRVLPPAWKRILRTVLTLLVSGLLLSAIVLRAAGLQRPESEQIPPKLVVIVLDNSPSMRALHDGKSRAQMAQERAQEIVDALGENDRGIIAHSNEGTLLLGRWLKRGEVLGDAPPTDFATPDYAALAVRLGALEPPPGVPVNPRPQTIAFLLTDFTREPEWLEDIPWSLQPVEGWNTRLGVPTLIETFGEAGANHAVTHARYEPPAPGDGNAGVVNFAAWKMSGPAMILRTADVHVEGLAQVTDGSSFTLPLRAEPYEVRVSVPAGDPLAQDDSVRMTVNERSLSRVTICSPDEENPILREALGELLPGLEILSAGPDDSVTTDLLVCDRALPSKFTARFLLCFGVIPADYGQVTQPVRAEPGLQLRVEPPRDLGLEVPDLTLLSAREAVPLADGHTLTPLARHIEGGTLVAVKRGVPDVLYCGFLPHKSTLLHQDYSGFLLLLRWLAAIQSGGREPIPPFVKADSETEFKLDRPAHLRVKLADSSWLPAHGPREFELTTGADGRGKLGPFTIPGEYVVTREGTEIGRFTAIWNGGLEQGLPHTPLPATELEALFGAQRESDWRDHLPGLLLWIALGLLVLEWLFWLVGVTE